MQYTVVNYRGNYITYKINLKERRVDFWIINNYYA